MENNEVRGRAGSTPLARRAFLSASALTAVTAPLLTSTVLAGAARAVDQSGHRSPVAFPQVVS